MNSKDKELLFKGIYTDYGQKIFRLCSGYIYEKEEVEDLFQEVLLNVWSSLERFRGESKLSTWVYRVTVNTALLHNRKSTVYKNMKQELLLDLPMIRTVEASGEDYQKEQDLKKLRYNIAKLNPEDKLIITLLLEGLKYEEIAEIVGITLNYVGVRINRIKKRLFKLMENQNNE